ncbi:hypothetical protein GOP47_0018067 [Adiantum capillus-veneris]|uniref:Uncharacterized protein n=1 Tax=Adiantum capillus-veneris TaxID=13818 RepID=A0A9D4ZAA4_ADICA|nr:hypothetical protein GOP47_0018067 [Adiantum capillus-veneris]
MKRCATRCGSSTQRLRLTKSLFLRWGHRHDFPAAQWRSLLGQTLARCVALRKQVEREVAQLRAEAAEYLYIGLLHRADEKVALASRGQKLYLAYILIQQYCEQAINHLIDIENCEGKECSLEAQEAISSLLYVMPRCEELIELRLLEPLISSKFGNSFVSAVAENSVLCAVDKKIILLLSWSVPNWPTRKAMLEKIAIDFTGSIKLLTTSFSKVPSNRASLRTFTKNDLKRSSNGGLSSTSRFPGQSIPCQGQSFTYREFQTKQANSYRALHTLSSRRSPSPSLSESPVDKNQGTKNQAASPGSAKSGKNANLQDYKSPTWNLCINL